MASRKNELELGFFVHSGFFHYYSVTTMMEITECISQICPIITCTFVLEYVLQDLHSWKLHIAW